MLKHIRNISDRQSSCGVATFRNRIGEQGIELILKESIRVNDDDNDNRKNDTAFIDSTGGNATRRLPDGACIKQMQNCIKR